MSKRVITELLGDLDGSVLGNDGESIQFEIDGTRYEIDLSAKNAAKLRKSLEPFIAAGRKISSAGRSRPAASSGKRDLRVVREWGQQNGHSVSERGRVPKEIVAAYDAANGS